MCVCLSAIIYSDCTCDSDGESVIMTVKANSHGNAEIAGLDIDGRLRRGEHSRTGQ